MREARRPTARTHAHEAFLRFPVEGLRADVASLALRVVRARLDRDRDGLFVLFVGIILFCVAPAVYSLTNLLVAAAPVVMLASGVTIARLTPNTPRRDVLGATQDIVLATNCETREQRSAPVKSNNPHNAIDAKYI